MDKNSRQRKVLRRINQLQNHLAMSKMIMTQHCAAVSIPTVLLQR